MSAGAKLFITLCKQTLSWTACRRGVRGGGRGVACEVRQGCERRCSLTPITLPLISPLRPLCSLLLTHRPPPHHHRPPPLPRTWGSARAAKRSLHFLLLFFLLSLFLLHFLPAIRRRSRGKSTRRTICFVKRKMFEENATFESATQGRFATPFSGTRHSTC